MNENLISTHKKPQIHNPFQYSFYFAKGTIETRTKIRLTVNDPRKINDLRTEETPDARLVIGPVSDELFEWARQAIYALPDLKPY